MVRLGASGSRRCLGGLVAVITLADVCSIEPNWTDVKTARTNTSSAGTKTGIGFLSPLIRRSERVPISRRDYIG